MDTRDSYEKYVTVTSQQEYRHRLLQYLGNKSQQNLYL